MLITELLTHFFHGVVVAARHRQKRIFDVPVETVKEFILCIITLKLLAQGLFVDCEFTLIVIFKFLGMGPKLLQDLTVLGLSLISFGH